MSYATKTFVFCAALLSAVAAFAGNPGSDTPSESSIRPVSVLFSAVDPAGSPIRDLAKDQIAVMDNNATATIADIHPVGDAPLSVGIVLLASQSNFKKEQTAAIDLVEKLIRSDRDRAFVVTAGGTKLWSQNNLEWQSDPEVLKKEIGALDKNAGMPEAFDYDVGRHLGDATTPADRWRLEKEKGEGASFFDAVWNMMLADKRPARRVLVMFRNRWTHVPGRLNEYRDFSDRKHAEIIANAQKLHVTMYAIGVEENPPDLKNPSVEVTGYGTIYNVGDLTFGQDRGIESKRRALYNTGRANVERLANETGGQAWWSGKYNDITGGIANALNGQYPLTFTPAAPTPGSHKLKVTCGSGARVTAPGAFLVAGSAAAK